MACSNPTNSAFTVLGGWTQGAAEAVCGHFNDLPSDLLPLLRSLIEKNLVTIGGGIHGELRFGMLQILQEFAVEQLSDSDELAATRRRHAMFFLDLAEQADRGFDSPEQGNWLERLERDNDNLRAALDWFVNSGEPSAASSGLRMGGALWLFWDDRGHAEEGRHRLATLLAQPGAQGRTTERLPSGTAVCGVDGVRPGEVVGRDSRGR
jgi:hypothetical protein